MTIQINTHFNPFRMRISDRKPVTLSVELVNDSDEAKMITMSVTLTRQLSFEKGGYKTEDVKRIKELPAGERRQFYYEVHPKAATKTIEQPVLVTVEEHYKDFSHIGQEYKKKLVLRVQD